MNIPVLIESNKPYFSTYSVMALNNAQNVLDHIQKIVDVKNVYCNKEGKLLYDKNTEDLWLHPVMSYLLSENQTHPEKTELIIKKLFSSFPFLKIMAENQRDYNNKKNGTKRVEVSVYDIKYPLESALRVLKFYRDYTTHYTIYDEKLIDGSRFLGQESSLANMLNKFFTVALRITKERFIYETQDLAFIQDNRYVKVKSEDGKRITINNPNFFLSMLSDNGDTMQKMHLSGVGVALLICLFIEKQYIHLFLSKLAFMLKYRADSEENRIIYRSFSIANINLPKERIHSDKDSSAIALDMLNELKRCPKELFDVISAENQSRFRVSSSDHQDVLLRRSSDRFAQLLLQYIDYGESFHTLRFHVNMGKLRFLFNADKHCIDGQSRVRVLEHPISGYGRIKEMEKKRKREDGSFADTGIAIRDFDNVQRDDANAANYPYIVDTYSHYVLENNKVDMSFEDNMPEIVPDDNGKWYVEKKSPDCRMSVFELPAMAFHMYLFGGVATEQRIKDTCAKYGRLFKTMSEKMATKESIADFAIGDLPKKVVDCIANGFARGKDYNAFVKRSAEEMLQDTNMRIERLKADLKTVNSAQNKMGRHDFRQIQTGKIADFLAKDMVKFQPNCNDGEDKITGMNYRVLQSVMATYNSLNGTTTPEQFRHMFVSAGLIGDNTNKRHAFLYRVFGYQVPKDIVSFYNDYLFARRRYLNDILRKIDNGESPCVPYANIGCNKWGISKQDYLGNVYSGDDVVLELPRQMFDADIKAKLMQMPEMEGIDFSRANVTYLIAEYLHRVKHDDFQKFYFFDRNYRYIDMLKCVTDEKGMLAKCYTSVEERVSLWEDRSNRKDRYCSWQQRNVPASGFHSRISSSASDASAEEKLAHARSYYQSTEKTIRRYKVQDALIFFFAKKALFGDSQFDEQKFRLCDIMPDDDKSVLSEVVPISLTFDKAGKRYTITSQSTKLKNYGDFYALANDKRLLPLLELVDTDVVSKEMLKDEFGNYDRCRPEVAKVVLDIEKWAFNAYPELYDSIKAEEKVDFKVILNMIKSLDGVVSYKLRKIRNSFEHNSYPERGVAEITALPEVARKIREVFGEYAKLIKN